MNFFKIDFSCSMLMSLLLSLDGSVWIYIHAIKLL